MEAFRAFIDISLVIDLGRNRGCHTLYLVYRTICFDTPLKGRGSNAGTTRKQWRYSFHRFPHDRSGLMIQLLGPQEEESKRVEAYVRSQDMV